MWQILNPGFRQKETGEENEAGSWPCPSHRTFGRPPHLCEPLPRASAASSLKYSDRMYSLPSAAIYVIKNLMATTTNIVFSQFLWSEVWPLSSWVLLAGSLSEDRITVSTLIAGDPFPAYSCDWWQDLACHGLVAWGPQLLACHRPRTSLSSLHHMYLFSQGEPPAERAEESWPACGRRLPVAWPNPLFLLHFAVTRSSHMQEERLLCPFLYLPGYFSQISGGENRLSSF